MQRGLLKSDGFKGEKEIPGQGFPFGFSLRQFTCGAAGGCGLAGEKTPDTRSSAPARAGSQCQTLPVTVYRVVVFHRSDAKDFVTGRKNNVSQAQKRETFPGNKPFTTELDCI